MQQPILNPQPVKKFALFELGFRPFFLLASLFSIIATSIWMANYTFGWILPVSTITPFAWHGHEMVFGYSLAIIAGFLLTAVRNWTGVQTIQNLPLLLLSSTWLLARILPLLDSPVLFVWAAFLDTLFLVGLTLAVLYPIIKVKQWRQLLIIALLVLLTIANVFYYLGVFRIVNQGVSWGLFSGVYLIMALIFTLARRVMPFFIERGVGYQVQLKLPLDFMVVSDHSEYLGVLVRMFDPNDPLSKHPMAEQVVGSGNDIEASTKAFYGLVSQTIQADGSTKPDPSLNTPELKRTIWDEYVKITDDFNEPGKFTTLVGYEWSSQPNMSNQHRNVIFRSSENLPVPFSYFDSQKAEDLWAWMDKQRNEGLELLAIPHNGNLSNGTMFATTDSDGKPISRAYAETRMRNERLTEIIQTKGQSETHPLMSPNDEFAGFEIWTKPVAGPGAVKVVETNYVRNAFRNGLAIKQKIGINPFKYGVVGGADIHTSIVSHEEYQHTGEHNLKSGTPHQRLLEQLPNEPSKIEQGTAGLSNVWAEENTREAIWDAMHRKETWATSGSRITVRVFAGFEFGDMTPANTDWVKLGYEKGVPMGGDLPSAIDGLAPSLMIAALKGPNSGNLDRIQVIKGWVDVDGNTHDKIYDVVWSGERRIDIDGKLPAVGNSVNIADASYTNTIGSSELQTVWTDPDFDPSVAAFYYLRVIEIPTPRWSTYDAKSLGIDPPKDFPATIQERAWSSPIWYTP
ncbi:MAG: DUF3604 domain-containing protein [Xanthomonadales bacterium]|nr:DUF3604 domain-containing protein [Xanthomonadales bacterium]